MEKDKAFNVCQYCGKQTYLPFRCPYCGGLFCEEHRLPEAHNCPSLREKRYVPHYSAVHVEYSERQKNGKGFEYIVYIVLLIAIIEFVFWAVKALG